MTVLHRPRPMPGLHDYCAQCGRPIRWDQRRGEWQHQRRRSEVSREDVRKAYVQHELQPMGDVIADSLTEMFQRWGFNVRAERQR